MKANTVAIYNENTSNKKGNPSVTFGIWAYKSGLGGNYSKNAQAMYRTIFINPSQVYKNVPELGTQHPKQDQL